MNISKTLNGLSDISVLILRSIAVTSEVKSRPVDDDTKSLPT